MSKFFETTHEQMVFGGTINSLTDEGRAAIAAGELIECPHADNQAVGCYNCGPYVNVGKTGSSYSTARLYCKKIIVVASEYVLDGFDPARKPFHAATNEEIATLSPHQIMDVKRGKQVEQEAPEGGAVRCFEIR